MYVLGIDVGTTGTKTLLMSKDGDILGRGYYGYCLQTAEGGIVEQDANAWWDAVICSVKEATKDFLYKDQICAISLSTQGATMVPIDKDGETLCQAITWMDSRAVEETEELKEQLSADYFYKKSGWRLAPTFDAAKILCLKKNCPEIFKQTSCFVSTVEFINFKLTNIAAIDPSNAAIRQLFDITTGDWDDRILQTLGITREVLPIVKKTGEYIGNLTEEAANQLGLSTDIKVYSGAHDQYCASLGCGAVKAGDMLLSTGTTWVILGITDHLFYTDSFMSPGIHPQTGLFGLMTSLVSSGSALQWFKNQFVEEDFKTLDEQASLRMEKCKDLFVLPYFAGAGFPHWKDNAFGSIIGLELKHDKFDIARAIMEGVAFEAKTALEIFEQNNTDMNCLKVMGGAAKSELWSKLIAAVTGCEIDKLFEADACCVGAAIIAAKGCGLYPSLSKACETFVKSEKAEAIPDEMILFYQKKYERYKKLRAKVFEFYEEDRVL